MKKLLSILYILLSSLNCKTQNQLYFPPLTGNTWDSIIPSSIGYCQARIDSLYNYLQLKNTKSFIILKNGKRVLEKYYGTYTIDSSWYWASAGKSLAAVITGIAQQKGFININNTVSSYLNQGWTTAPIANESTILVNDLLKMTSGLNDNPPFPCDNDDTAKSCLNYLVAQNTRWAYHTGAYRKIQDVVSKAVNQTYNQITTSWIKNKIGMGGFWSNQVYYSKARDMARFGLLCLNKGIWQQDTVLKDSIYFKNMINSSQAYNKAYGYLWWLNGKTDYMLPGTQTVYQGTLLSNAPADTYIALGKNDQKIYVVPSQNLVVIRQGNSAGTINLALSTFDNVLWDYINKLSCNTSLNDAHLKNDFLIYPNPTSNVLNISSSNLVISEIEIMSSTGKKIYSSNSIKNKVVEVNTKNIEPGMYFVKLKFENGNIATKKFIKH